MQAFARTAKIDEGTMRRPAMLRFRAGKCRGGFVVAVGGKDGHRLKSFRNAYRWTRQASQSSIQAISNSGSPRRPPREMQRPCMRKTLPTPETPPPREPTGLSQASPWSPRSARPGTTARSVTLFPAFPIPTPYPSEQPDARRCGLRTRVQMRHRTSGGTRCLQNADEDSASVPNRWTAVQRRRCTSVDTLWLIDDVISEQTSRRSTGVSGRPAMV